MANQFDDMLAQMDGWVEASFGTTITITPQVRSEYAGYTADQSRAVVGVAGVFSLAPIIDPVLTPIQGPKGISRAATQSASLWLSSASLAAIGYDLRKGDKIAVAGRADEWRVSAPMDAAEGGTEFYLVPASGVVE